MRCIPTTPRGGWPQITQPRVRAEMELEREPDPGQMPLLCSAKRILAIAENLASGFLNSLVFPHC